MNADTVLDPVQSQLARDAAATLGLFAGYCRCRTCRRHRACIYTLLPTQLPLCIDNLLREDNLLLHTLLDVLFRIHAGRYESQPSPDPYRRTVEELAILILKYRPEALTGRKAQYDDWLRRFRAPPPPPVDAGALAREIRATMAVDEIREDFLSRGRS